MPVTDPTVGITGASLSDHRFFGHPRGLATLFFTEMWERFSYYGMRAILVLFMTAKLKDGGLGFSDTNAGAIYGLYGALVYLLGLPGGWIADSILGKRSAVLYGGIVIALGHFALAVPTIFFFYLGLALIAIGTGLLKPNVSAMVGELYDERDQRRDAGFSIFYMGINIGAMISPIIVGYVGEKINWHYGFAIAGIGMTIGLIQYIAGYRHLGRAGLLTLPKAAPEAARQKRYLLIGTASVVSVVAALWILGATGMAEITPVSVANGFGYVLPVVIVGLFVSLYVSSQNKVERHRLIAIMALFLTATLFWAIFEQAGSTLNLFAERNTDLHFLGYEFPASWFQAENSLFLILLAPVFAWIWLKLGRRDPSSPAKFAAGLVLAAVGLLVLLPVAGAKHVSPMWLTLTYFIHTVGELCLSPVGLSTMTKLAPARLSGLMMGVWFAASAVGNFLAGQLTSVSEHYSYYTLFVSVGALALVLALVMFLFVPTLKRLMSGVN